MLAYGSWKDNAWTSAMWGVDSHVIEKGAASTLTLRFHIKMIKCHFILLARSKYSRIEKVRQKDIYALEEMHSCPIASLV
jgi:hypothetical protein